MPSKRTTPPTPPAESPGAAQRRLSATVAAHTKWGNTADRTAATAAARAAADARFYAQTPADLPDAQRRAMAANLRKAHIARMTAASLRARQSKATGGAA